MTTLLRIAVVLFLTSCSVRDDSNEKVVAPISTQTDTLVRTTQDFPNHAFDTTLVINKKTFVVKTRDLNSDFVSLAINSDFFDTLESPGLLNVGFVDLNKDGNKDILISYIGNNPTHELYLFDPIANSFRWLDGFINYPDAVQLRVYPKFYYSYHRAGCADMNWVSDLFKIENFKTIEIGSIYGKGCEDELQEIEISQIIDNDEGKAKLIKKLPYKKHITDVCDKWSFIEKYWNRNYSKFQ